MSPVHECCRRDLQERSNILSGKEFCCFSLLLRHLLDLQTIPVPRRSSVSSAEVVDTVDVAKTPAPSGSIEGFVDVNTLREHKATSGTSASWP